MCNVSVYYHNTTNISKHFTTLISLFYIYVYIYTFSTLFPGIAAATMFMPDTQTVLSDTQLRVAFDGDAVLFSDESEIIVKQHGLDTFFEHEKEFENKPLAQVSYVCTPRMFCL